MKKFVSIGKIINFHGIKGCAKVGFTKNQEEFFLSLKAVFVKQNNEYVKMEIESSKLHNSFAIVKFVGIDSINDLLPFKGLILFVEKETVRETLGEDEFLIDELIGLNVLDSEDKKVGFIIGVSNNGANDLLAVKTKPGSVSLVPFVKAIVTDVNMPEKFVRINNIEGLLE